MPYILNNFLLRETVTSYHARALQRPMQWSFDARCKPHATPEERCLHRTMHDTQYERDYIFLVNFLRMDFGKKID